MKKASSEFRDFIMKGNVLDLAIGVIIGGAFGAIVNSLVKDVIMPPIGLLLGKVDFSNLYINLTPNKVPLEARTSLAAAQEAGAVTLNYGAFIMSIISFLIIAICIFAIVKAVNKLRGSKKSEVPAEPTEKTCPFCISTIPIAATRCPHCTSKLD
jgi:large conductance mechanosensitive channel